MPDIMTAAKPVACGIPLGIIAANERAAKSIRPGMHGSTFGGNALAARVSLEFFDILEGLLPQIRRVGDYFRTELTAARRPIQLHHRSARLRTDDRRAIDHSRQGHRRARHEGGAAA